MTHGRHRALDILADTLTINIFGDTWTAWGARTTCWLTHGRHMDSGKEAKSIKNKIKQDLSFTSHFPTDPNMDPLSAS